MQAQAVDRATVRRILRLDDDLAPHEACGAAAINGALLAARRHDLAPRLLDLHNSGNTGGGFDRVVGYGALAFEAHATLTVMQPAGARAGVALDAPVLETAPTPPATLRRARAIALGNGLHHVYTGNVHDVEGGTTFCPGCHEALVRRDWHKVLDCRIDSHGDARGTCPFCGTPIAGRFAAFRGGFGRRRIPVQLAA